MKFLKILSFFLLVSVSISYSQTDPELVSRAKKSQINKIPTTVDQLKNSTFDYYENDINSLKGNKLYNATVLNAHFKEVITAYATSTGDASFNEYILNANSSEKTLTIGGSFRLDNIFAFSKKKRDAIKKIKPLQRIGNIITIYLKSNYSNGFSNLYSRDSETEEFNFSSNIGTGLKFTHVFTGWISDKKPKKVKYVRNNVIKKSIESKLKKYVDNSFDDELKVKNFDVTNLNTQKENKQDLIETKFFEFYKAILDEELKYAKDQNLFATSHTFWISAEAYIPLTDRVINYSTDFEKILKANFRNYNFQGTGNYLLSAHTNSFLKKYSLKVTFNGSIFKTNEFIANNVKAVNFQEIIQNNGNVVVEGTTNSVFTGKYHDFWSTSLKGEFVSLFFNNTIGIGAAIEQTYGDVKNTNWKLGIPVSLKDKEDKPSINFELQWRKINNSHFVGLSIGYNFGKFVK